MKRRIVICLAAVLVCAMAVPTLAARKTAQVRPDFDIVIDEEESVFVRAGGEVIYPLLFEGTTYLPLRAIGEMMGKNVNWDETTKTVTIGGVREKNNNAGKKDNTAKTEVTVEERTDFTIVIDGNVQKFKSTSGAEINPLLYEGSVYLPLRAIGQIMGKDVIWDDKEKKVTLENSTVTDADSFVEGTTGTTNNTTDVVTNGNDIGIGKAKEIALNHAGLTEKEVRFVKTKMDRDDGRKIYEVEFYFGTEEYDYDIDATTGKIISYDYDVDVVNNTTTDKDKASITLAEAKKIALNHAGLKEKDVTFIKATTDYDDGKQIFDVEFRQGNMEYEYEISITGTILEFDKDNDND